MMAKQTNVGGTFYTTGVGWTDQLKGASQRWDWPVITAVLQNGMSIQILHYIWYNAHHSRRLRGFSKKTQKCHFGNLIQWQSLIWDGPAIISSGYSGF
jgi:hypothetical protein